jgi:hypothetical protein
MASEDSDQLVPGFWRFMVCAISTISIRPSEVRCLPVETSSTQRAKASKSSRFDVSNGCSWEERNNRFHQLRASIDAILQEILAMVVAPCVPNDPADPEEALKLLEAAGARSALRDRKAVSHLIAGFVAAPVHPVWLTDEADREAPFSVYKTNNPASVDQPFLLIFRTVQIVTEHRKNLCRVPDGYTGFSSI